MDICYPTFVHREYVTSVLQRGKHVLCETPLALTLEDAEAKIAAARCNGKLLLVALVMWFVDAYTYICDTIRAGDLGKPLVACTTHLAASRLATGCRGRRWRVTEPERYAGQHKML